MSRSIATIFFSSRLYASAADYVLVAGAVKTILFILPTFFLSPPTQTNVTSILVALIPTLYYSWFEMSSFRATPGKMLAQLHVVCDTKSGLSVFGYTLLASAVFWAMICLSSVFISLLCLPTNANLSFPYLSWAALLISWPLACVPFNTNLGSRTVLDIVSRKTIEPRITPSGTFSTQFLWAMVIGFSAALLRTVFSGDTASIFFGTLLCSASVAYLIAGVVKFQPINIHRTTILANRQNSKLVQDSTGFGICTVSEPEKMSSS